MLKFLPKLNHKKWLTIGLVCLVVMFSFGLTSSSLAQSTSNSNSSGVGSAAAKLAFRSAFPLTSLAADAVEALGLGGKFSCATSPDCWISFIMLTLYKILSTLLGFIILGLTVILKVVLEYDDWVNSPAVINGWGIVRDITNMFFILVLLVIAISTILRIQSYNFKRLLPKVLLAALLVNFSLVIAGLMLDASQVVMNSFVRAFISTFSESLYDSLSVKEILFSADSTVNLTTQDGIQFTQVAANAVLGLIMLSLIAFVIGVMVIVLVARMIMLWFLLVLAPLPYLLASFPQGQRYAQQWWEEFTKYLIVGPLLAFFLWLNFVVVKASTVVTGFTDANAQAAFNNSSGVELNLGLFSGITTPQQQLSMIISIGMLMAGLMFTQRLSVAGSSAAGAVFNKAKSMGVNTLKGTARWSLRRADDAQAGIQRGLANTRLGNALLNNPVGRAIGLDRLQKGGIKLRTIPGAVKAVSEEREKRRTQTSAAVAQDIVSRVTPSGWVSADNRTDQVTKIVQKETAEKEKQIKEEGDSTNEGMASRLAEIIGRTKDGSVKQQDLSEARALYGLLTKQGGLSELYKHNQVTSLVGADYNSGSFKNLMQKNFGQTAEDNHGRLEKIAKDNNTEIIIQGGTEFDSATKKRIFTQANPSKGFATAAAAQADKIDQTLGNKENKEVIKQVKVENIVDQATGVVKTDEVSRVLMNRFMKSLAEAAKNVSTKKTESILKHKNLNAFLTESARLRAAGNTSEARQIEEALVELYKKDNKGNSRVTGATYGVLIRDLRNIAATGRPATPGGPPGTPVSTLGGKVYT